MDRIPASERTCERLSKKAYLRSELVRDRAGVNDGSVGSNCVLGGVREFIRR